MKFALVCENIPRQPWLVMPAGGVFTLGRGSKCDLVLKHPSVSRVHATLKVFPAHIHLEDMGSRYGTFSEKGRIDSADFKAEDEIRFGEVLCVIRAIPGGENDSDLDNSSQVETALAHEPRVAHDASAKKFTAGQKRVFDLVLKGLSEKQIAHKLHLSVHTVHTHMKRIYAALKVRSRAELLAKLLLGP